MTTKTKKPRKQQNNTKVTQSRLGAKQRHRAKLIEYLGNPENDFPNRSAMPGVLGIKRTTLYHHFTPAELSEIEKEGLDARRTKYASLIAHVDQGLLKRAKEGDPQAAKLIYQRFEDWTEKQINKHVGDQDGPIRHEHGLSTEAQGLLDELIGKGEE